ncbi:MAG: hypothetical protein GXY61_04350 [Lentisphaerae bacterium]|nr:hypothetical protein [Lentisphaerota bacterium]
MENESRNIEIESKPRKRFFLAHKNSSALVVAIALHAVFAVYAVGFVVVRAMKPEPAVFVATEVPRPQPKLKKIEIPVKDSKKNKAPKLRQMITTKPNVAVSLQMPEMVGIKGGSGYGKGTGLGGMGLGFDFDLFGGGSGSGNELVGTFYDLKQRQDGKLTSLGKAVEEEIKKAGGRLNLVSNETQDDVAKVIKSFINSGFKESRLEDYFKAPKLKYAQTIMMPKIDAAEAPKAFSVQDQVEARMWLCHYKGQIAAPETGEYRFCGLGDDVLAVRLDGKLVIDACWPSHIGKLSSWESDDENNRRFSIDGSGSNNAMGFGGGRPQNNRQFPGGGGGGGGSNNGMVIGDWVKLEKGKPVDIDIVIGEIPGGEFLARLLIEQKGKTYRMVGSGAGRRPVLPVFKTVEIDDPEMIKLMKLNDNEMTLDGPVFGVKINAEK